jgi:hypothetical protein
MSAPQAFKAGVDFDHVHAALRAGRPYFKARRHCFAPYWAGTVARCRRKGSSINQEIVFDHCHPSVWAHDESLMSGSLPLPPGLRNNATLDNWPAFNGQAR